MKGLVVVHTEMNYVEQTSLGSRLLGIYEDIGAEIQQYLDRDEYVYYLPGGSEVHPSIARHLELMRVMTADPLVRMWGEMQMLETKEHAIAKGLEEYAICGVAHDECVMMLYNLLSGNDLGRDDILFGIASETLQWSDEKYDKILNYQLNATIKRNLTDKRFM